MYVQFGLSNSSLELPGMDDYLQLQQDSVACRVRAKRGCATHPRSIAERVSSSTRSFPTDSLKKKARRNIWCHTASFDAGLCQHRNQFRFPCSLAYVQERRTRISKRLKKLQDLVPNMDKVS